MRKLVIAAVAIAFANACSGKLAAPMIGTALPATAPNAGAMSMAGIKEAFRTSYTDQFQRADVNKDGSLVPAEVPNVPPDFFQTLDKDKDGKLSLKEYVTYYMKVNADFMAGFHLHAVDAMKQYDTNKDGWMSFAEFRAVTASFDPIIQQKYLWAFKASDKRNDGKLNLSELEDFIAWDYAMMDMVTHPSPYPGSAYPVPPTTPTPSALPSTPGPIQPTAAPTAIPSTPDH